MSKKKTETSEPVVKDNLTGKEKVIKVLKVILNTAINILIVVVLLVSLLIAVMALSSKDSGISKIFGFTIQTIQSDSMKGKSPDGYEGGDFEAGDLVIGKSTEFDEYAEYEVGDIITYRGYDSNDEMYLMAHRIVDRVKGQDGYYRYQTWGDNRKVSEAPDQLEESDFLAAFDIGSVIYSKDYHCTVIKGLGGFLDKLKNDKAFFFMIVLLPMIIFFMYALIRVVLSATNYRKEMTKEEKADAEEEKQKEIDAAVKAALAAKNGEDAKPADAPADMTPEQMEQFKQFLAFQKAQQAAETPAEVSPETPADESDETPETAED